jgi:phosphoesterase RecJ-like protein
MTPIPAEILNAIRSARRIGLAAHVRPDGDAVGSVTGLALSLKLAGKEVFPILEDGIPPHLAFLPGTDLVKKPSADAPELDLALALDTATHERLGEGVAAVFAKAPLLINIDHHGTNERYGHLQHIDIGSPAVGQIVYDLIQQAALPMDDSVRQNLFAAISTDTGSFQFSSTGARTHRIVAEMLENGLDTARLATLLYQSHPRRRIELQRAMLNEMTFRAQDRIVSWNLTQQLIQSISMLPGDTEGLIDTLRMIDSVVACVIFEETENGKVRVSARSKDTRVNVSDVCAQFGGGGHRMAAGARLKGPISEASTRFLSALEDEVLRRLD